MFSRGQFKFAARKSLSGKYGAVLLVAFLIGLVENSIRYVEMSSIADVDSGGFMLLILTAVILGPVSFATARYFLNIAKQ